MQGHALRWAIGGAGASLLMGLSAITVTELPYVNWLPVAAPVETTPLTIRHDAKGDGRFLAPRSGRHFHQGIDLLATMDSPVRAIRSGRVVEAGTRRGLGKYVWVEHRGALRSLYAHLSQIEVKAGDRVRQGQLIGRVGKSGNARHRWILPHVHLEVRLHGEPVNPQRLGLFVKEPAEAPSDETHAYGGE